MNKAVAKLLEGIGERTRSEYKQGGMIRSFAEYLDEVWEHPAAHTRDTVRYVLAMVDHFGSRMIPGVTEPIRRLNVFDDPCAPQKAPVFGQEHVQGELLHHLTTFARRGRVDKLLVFHGPNGSGKSTIIEALTRGLEAYSRTPEGALYRFNWVFSERYEGGGLGFHGPRQPSTRQPETFAYLDAEDVSNLVPCELCDHPLLLVPTAERRPLLQEACADHDHPVDLPDAIAAGELCPKCRTIYDALLNVYQGDWLKVMRHVQVERFFISKRYRRGAVVIQPQGNVDASSRAVGYDRNFQLPPALQTAQLFEGLGDLIDANRGIVEYSDFFKRPPEVNKYLLTTSEKGIIHLPNYLAYLDLVLVATANEKNLNIFKENRDFPSFKGRMELIKVPYLLEFSKEAQLYHSQLPNLAREKHISPHTAEVASLWAVLTRLRRPRKSNYESPSLGALAERLTPVEKAYLYDRGQPPEGFQEAERRELLAKVEQLRREFQEAEEKFENRIDAAYEGRRGASAREVLATLADAASYSEFPCLSPLAVFKALRGLVKDSSVYDFLRLEARGAYRNPSRFIADVEEDYLTRAREELQEAVALVEEKEYQRLFDDYFVHVKAYEQGERLRNRSTGELEEPDERLMEQVEGTIGLSESPDQFRSGLITRIAAWSIDHPQQVLDYHRLFGDIFRALRLSFYEGRAKKLQLIQRHLLMWNTDELRSLSSEDRLVVDRTMGRLTGPMGYCPKCAKEMVAFVLQRSHA